MKHLVSCFFFIFCLAMLNAQNSEFVLVLKYRQYKIGSENKLTMPQTMGDSKGWNELMDLFNADSVDFKIFVSADTILNLTYINNRLLNSIRVISLNKEWSVNLSNGIWLPVNSKITKKITNDYFENNKINIEQSGYSFEKQKKQKKQEKIHGFMCDVWEEVSSQMQSEVKTWVTPEFAYVFPQFSDISFKGQLIVKTESSSSLGQERKDTRVLQEIDTIIGLSIKDEINKLLNIEIGSAKKAYTNLEDNKLLIQDSVKVQSNIGNFHFKIMEKDSTSNIEKAISDASFLLIDIWASWCSPCLKSFPELNKLKQAYTDSLQILSLNYADTDLGKVKEVLKKYTPDWPQGFASHQVHDLLNPMRMYPSMVLIDRNGKVVMMGKPDLSLNEIRTFLDEHITPRK